jgi:hypothetical protein
VLGLGLVTANLVVLALWAEAPNQTALGWAVAVERIVYGSSDGRRAGHGAIAFGPSRLGEAAASVQFSRSLGGAFGIALVTAGGVAHRPVDQKPRGGAPIRQPASHQTSPQLNRPTSRQRLRRRFASLSVNCGVSPPQVVFSRYRSHFVAFSVTCQAADASRGAVIRNNSGTGKACASVPLTAGTASSRLIHCMVRSRFARGLIDLLRSWIKSPASGAVKPRQPIFSHPGSTLRSDNLRPEAYARRQHFHVEAHGFTKR